MQHCEWKLEKETFVGFYEFSDDFYWDKMIVKDEMTAVLVKDGNYLWARRTSKRDQYGVVSGCLYGGLSE